MGDHLVSDFDQVAPRLELFAAETRTVAQRETARRHRAVLEQYEFVPQEGLEPPTYGLEERGLTTFCVHYFHLQEVDIPLERM